MADHLTIMNHANKIIEYKLIATPFFIILVSRLQSAINASLWPHPTKLVFNIPILDRSQRFKQLQKAMSNFSIAKLNLHMAVRDTLNRLEISLAQQGIHTVITAAVPQAATSEKLAT